MKKLLLLAIVFLGIEAQGNAVFTVRDLYPVVGEFLPPFVEYELSSSTESSARYYYDIIDVETNKVINSPKGEGAITDPYGRFSPAQLDENSNKALAVINLMYMNIPMEKNKQYKIRVHFKTLPSNSTSTKEFVFKHKAYVETPEYINYKARIGRITNSANSDSTTVFDSKITFLKNNPGSLIEDYIVCDLKPLFGTNNWVQDEYFYTQIHELIPVLSPRARRAITRNIVGIAQTDYAQNYLDLLGEANDWDNSVLFIELAKKRYGVTSLVNKATQ